MKRKMNTRKKRALSPVVASIILIAVTVAVSIAVAAWMGALTVGFMATEELKITSMSFAVGPPKTIVVVASNTGTTPVTLNSATVNGVAATSVTYSSGSDTTGTVAANAKITITITPAADWTNGSNYQVKLTSTKGNTFMYTAVAPA
jgi:archaeal type IV pilus assembly protein PilA